VPPVVLASASPRRREILSALGVEFDVVATGVEEVTDGPPADAVLENALRKARAGAAMAPEAELIIGADTDVVLDGRVLGKAPDPPAARAHLEALSGRTHEVLSAIAIVDPSGSERTELERSLVTFRELDEATLGLYLASEEWRDRAGAYAIQGLGSILIERLEGDFSNVVGLPVRALLRMAPELAPKP
jgi:septum formation protein